MADSSIHGRSFGSTDRPSGHNFAPYDCLGPKIGLPAHNLGRDLSNNRFGGFGDRVYSPSPEPLLSENPADLVTFAARKSGEITS